jgi:hypothetical protein
MKKTDSVTIGMVAPCGINCGVCIAFLRDKNKCVGCWAPGNKKPNHCMTCRIKNCEYLAITESKFCYECSQYPCIRLKQMDKRYRTKYNMSIFENLGLIKDSGLDKFIQLENVKWKCKNCGGTICVHRGYCIECDKQKDK